MKEICLYNLEQAGIIILQPSGIHYFNQTGGVPFSRSKAEGIFVPISNDPPEGMPELEVAPRLSAICHNKAQLHLEDANAIDAVLTEISSTDVFSVNIQKLQDSKEAWVYVNVLPQGDYSYFQGFGEFEAILTWPQKANSENE